MAVTLSGIPLRVIVAPLLFGTILVIVHATAAGVLYGTLPPPKPGQ